MTPVLLHGLLRLKLSEVERAPQLVATQECWEASAADDTCFELTSVEITCDLGTHVCFWTHHTLEPQPAATRLLAVVQWPWSAQLAWRVYSLRP